MSIGVPSPINRIEAMNKPMVCEKCGGSHFYSVDVQQFAGGGYGSSEFRPLTNNPQSMKICICGNPISPTAQAGGGKSALGERERYQHSLQLAKDYRSKFDVQAIAKSTASREDLVKLQADVAQQLAALASRVSEIDIAEPKKKEPDAVKTPARPR